VSHARAGGTGRAIAGLVLSCAVTGSLLVAASAPARASATRTIADWEMNEPSGSAVMLDSSGNGIDGAIGSGVVTGATYDGATGYRWLFASPTEPPAKPERVIEASDGRLNPGGDDYAVTLRYRTTQPFGNIVQKGQGGATGGYFKIENPGGVLTCVFRGVDEAGNFLRKEVNSGTPLNDGQWHTARCERTATQLTLTVDGALVATSNGRTGSISNSRPISIAGKVNCDQITITCDYFTGDIDYIRIEGSEPTPPPPPPGDRVFKDHFNSGTFANWTTVKHLVIDGTDGGRKAPSARANPVNAAAWAARDLGDSYGAVCVRFSLSVTAASGSVDLIRLKTATNDGVAKLVRSSSGSLQIRSDVSGVTRDTGSALPAGWNKIKLCGTVGAAGTWDLYLNGESILGAWKANTGTTPVGRIQIGSTAPETLTINYDDVVVFG
jgi:hypothetical protein